MVEHGRGLRSAIDIVAKGNDPLLARYARGIGDDFGFKRLQLREATVHVADGVDGRRPLIEDETRAAGMVDQSELRLKALRHGGPVALQPR